MFASEGSEYDFKLCVSADDLCAAYNLRMEVFHEEQKFPKELEVDRYDPMSAHFIVTSKKHNLVVATVRLCPYPFESSSSDTFTLEHENFPLGAVRSETEIVNQFIGASSLPINGSELRGFKLGRLAVRKLMRSKGVGAMTVTKAENWLLENLRRTDDFKQLTVILSSQVQAKKFYEKMGYVAEGEPYDEDGAPHVLCRKELIA